MRCNHHYNTIKWVDRRAKLQPEGEHMPMTSSNTITGTSEHTHANDLGGG